MILEIAGLALLVFVAAFFLVPMFRTAGRQTTRGQWPRVKAEVLSWTVRQQGRTGLAEYRVRYRFNGAEEERALGSPDGLGWTNYHSNGKVRRAVDAKMKRHPVGSQIDVMINPVNPSEAYFVERELPVRIMAFVVLAIFTTFFLIFAAVAFGWI